MFNVVPTSFDEKWSECIRKLLPRCTYLKITTMLIEIDHTFRLIGLKCSEMWALITPNIFFEDELLFGFKNGFDHNDLYYVFGQKTSFCIQKM